MKQQVRDMLAGIIWIWILAFLVFAFFSPWVYKIFQ